MEKHVTVVAAIHIGFGALGILIALAVLVAVVGAGIISGDPEAKAITSFVGPTISFFIVLISVPYIIGGIGLLRRRSWARILVLIVSILDLIDIPIGTIAGVYSIWVLVKDETLQLFTPKSL